MLIFLFLVAVPIIEIALFIQVGGWLGLWPTIGIVILTAAIGTVLLRAQGLAALGELQRRLGAGEDPSSTLAHGAMILVAGVLLLTPGFFTDAVGFALLTPPVRAAGIRMAIRFAQSRMTARMTRVHMSVHRSGGGPHGPEAGPGTVDGEYEVVDPEAGGPGQDTRRDTRQDTRQDTGADTRLGGSGWTRAPGGKPGP